MNLMAAKRVAVRREPERLHLRSLIRDHSELLSETLGAHLDQVLEPAEAKTFRRLGPAEVARLLGIQESFLRDFARANGIGHQERGGRRTYSAEELNDLRHKLEANGRTKGKYVPARTGNEHLQVISVVNFKGGSAKTTTSAHLLQYLALRGYRTLGIDLDPQASLTALFGVQPGIDMGDGDSMYGAIGFDCEQRPMASIIRPTYLPNLFLAPGALELMEFEHETPKRLGEKGGATVFFNRVSSAIAEVDQDFDVVVIDCPPQLGFLSLSAIAAATSVLITIHPEMLDVMSMQHFLKMSAQLLDVIAEALVKEGSTEEPAYDWMRYLVTRVEPQDGPQNDMVALLRAQFGPFVMNHPALKSTAISDANLTGNTLYEVERSAFTRSTYDRAVESVDAVNGEIEGLIRRAWGRK